MIGKKVIVRADRAGVFFGTLVKKEGSDVTLANARKLWYWDGAAAIEELALSGTSKPKNCKFTVWLDEIIILGVIQILSCSEASVVSISEVPEWMA